MELLVRRFLVFVRIHDCEVTSEAATWLWSQMFVWNADTMETRIKRTASDIANAISTIELKKGLPNMSQKLYIIA